LKEAGDEVCEKFRHVFRREFWKPDPNAYKTESIHANLRGLLIMICIVMHAKYEGWENVTSNLVTLLQSFNEEEDAFQSLAVMVFGIAMNKVSSIRIEYANRKQH